MQETGNSSKEFWRFLFYRTKPTNFISTIISLLCHENIFLCLHYNLDCHRTCRKIALNHKRHKGPWDQHKRHQLNRSQAVQLCQLQPEIANTTHIFPHGIKSRLSYFYTRCKQHNSRNSKGCPLPLVPEFHGFCELPVLPHSHQRRWQNQNLGGHFF